MDRNPTQASAVFKTFLILSLRAELMGSKVLGRLSHSLCTRALMSLNLDHACSESGEDSKNAGFEADSDGDVVGVNIDEVVAVADRGTLPWSYTTWRMLSLCGIPLSARG